MLAPQMVDLALHDFLISPVCFAGGELALQRVGNCLRDEQDDAKPLQFVDELLSTPWLKVVCPKVVVNENVSRVDRTAKIVENVLVPARKAEGFDNYLG